MFALSPTSAQPEENDNANGPQSENSSNSATYNGLRIILGFVAQIGITSSSAGGVTRTSSARHLSILALPYLLTNSEKMLPLVGLIPDCISRRRQRA